MKLLVDLGSGLGGASEAFVGDSEWDVLRFDNAEEVQGVPKTIQMDYVQDIQSCIARIHLEILTQKPTEVIIWASPECKQWSDGFNSEKCKKRREGEVFIPDLSQITAIRHIIEVIKPTSWIIENVKGGREFLNPILGEPRLYKNPYYFWGEFPVFRIEGVSSDKSKLGPSKMRYWERSKIPIEISRSFKRALENQTRLGDFFHEI